MERLTERDGKNRTHTKTGFFHAVNRLASIEDILGDDYDLERLKELVEADRDGRCVVFQPGYPLASYYFRTEDNLCVRDVSGVVSEAEFASA